MSEQWQHAVVPVMPDADRVKEELIDGDRYGHQMLVVGGEDPMHSATPGPLFW